MSLYRVYVIVRDEYAGESYTRIGRTYGELKAALAYARKASTRHGTAEVKDDSRSIRDRLLTIFRDGIQIVPM